MLAAFLVDNENLVSQAISQWVQGNKLDIKMIETAENGQNAIEYIGDNKVNIVITNIKKFVLEDIEFIDYIYSHNKCIEYVILSGYGEIKCMKEAIKCGIEPCLSKSDNVENIKDILMALKKEIEGAYEISIESPELKKERDCVAKVKRCVERYLACPELSLKWIAKNHLYMNPDYLGKVFLKENGERFSVYLSKKRVERAKKLITIWKYDKVCEIAEHVGLGHNPQYFSQVFKKYEGCLPREYQQKYNKE